MYRICYVASRNKSACICVKLHENMQLCIKVHVCNLFTGIYRKHYRKSRATFGQQQQQWTTVSTLLLQTSCARDFVRLKFGYINDKNVALYFICMCRYIYNFWIFCLLLITSKPFEIDTYRLLMYRVNNVYHLDIGIIFEVTDRYFNFIYMYKWDCCRKQISSGRELPRYLLL